MGCGLCESQPILLQEFVVDEEHQSYSFVRPFASTAEHPSLTRAQLDSWFSALHPASFGSLNAGAWTDARYKVMRVPWVTQSVNLPEQSTCSDLIPLRAGRATAAQDSLVRLRQRMQVRIRLLRHLAAAD